MSVIKIKFDNEELYFLPLGGSGHFGSNLNLYGYQGKWLMVDCGMGFADDTLPGVDILMPDPAFIQDRRKDLVGAFITHAHEDHIGAMAILWPRLRCPVYATPFTAELLRKKFGEFDWGRQVKIHEVALDSRFDVSPFDIELVTVAHSIPESSAVVIRTPTGIILNTGDWKVDPTPVVGGLTDEKRFRALGQEGVLAVVGDSTGAVRDGHSGSEQDVQEEFLALFPDLKNRIVVTMFSSNIARINSVYKAATQNGRSVALIGRSLWRMHDAAKKLGYLKANMNFLTEEEAMGLPRDRIVMICTGSQGEYRAALTRIAEGEHRTVELTPGDHVLYSSFDIPGNEMSINRVKNLLISKGMNVITKHDYQIHVSGHGSRDEIVAMYQWTKPQIAIPVHGEHQHMDAHAEIARQCQIPQVVEPENGTLIRLAPGKAEIVDRVEAQMLALEGNRLVPVDYAPIRARERLMHTGHIAVTIVVDQKGRLAAGCQVSAPGVVDDQSDEGIEILAEAEEALEEAVDNLARRTRPSDDQIETEARRTINRFFRSYFDKKSKISVHLVRV